MKKLLTTITFVFCLHLLYAQDILTPQQYIEKYKDLAIREMKRMGVPAAITLAQGILETQNGNSDLVKKSNNHFGIKCKTSWTAQGVFHDDDATGECFRKYQSADESYRDHSNFLRGSDRYHYLFKLDVRDYKAWAYGLKNAGYATNPEYPKILIKNIEQYNLQQYTLQGANDVPKYYDGETLVEPTENLPQTLTQTELAKIHIVAPKEGLYAIAKKYNVTVQQLINWNNLKGNILVIGQKLIVSN